MKRVLMSLLILLGFAMAGYEEEEAREHHRDGYYGEAYPRGRYYGEDYPREYRGREYRLSDEAIQNGRTEQIDAEIQE